MRSVLLLLALFVACSLLEDHELRVTATPESNIALPTAPLTVEVIARNVGDGRVDWGQGSSTCQLDLLVRVGDENLVAADPTRACTADLVDHALAPGESRTERHRWAGHVLRGDSVERLEPGTYELRAAAGRVAVSDPVQVELQAGPGS